MRVGLTPALALMKRLPFACWVLLGVAFVSEAFACTVAPADDEFARSGRNVIIGTVVSTKFAARPSNASVGAIASTSTHQLGDFELLVKVKVRETLHGTAPSVVTAVSPCALPLQGGERVVVATYSGRRNVFPASMYEHSFRAVYPTSAN